jgi:LysR family transcriptional regulator (chromosome initiation inhibitor)
LGEIEYLAIASPEFIRTNFPGGVTLEAVAAATCLIYDRKDLLPQNWLLDAFGQSVPLRGHWLASFPGYLACCLNGAGWGMMPRDTVSQSLSDGELEELVPGTKVTVPLHWQASTRGSEIMRILSNTVVSVARRALLQRPAR